MPLFRWEILEMSIKKIVIARGGFNNIDCQVLVSFDCDNKPLDIIALSRTLVGSKHTAVVEKVLNYDEACLVKLDTGLKAYIENKNLFPDLFILRHSNKKIVCQGDIFDVVISQDPKFNKPSSCKMIKEASPSKLDFIIDLLTENHLDLEIISDAPLDTLKKYRLYKDEDILLWDLYGFSSIIEKSLIRRSFFKGDGNLAFDFTEALTIIDVNCGGNRKKVSAIDNNKLALTEAFRQIRNRSVSGMILIDLLKARAEEAELISFAKKLAKDDYVICQVHDITRLGIMEITRGRIFCPLAEVFDCSDN